MLERLAELCARVHGIFSAPCLDEEIEASFDWVIRCAIFKKVKFN